MYMPSLPVQYRSSFAGAVKWPGYATIAYNNDSIILEVQFVKPQWRIQGVWTPPSNLNMNIISI